jgi:hypothetical protein
MKSCRPGTTSVLTTEVMWKDVLKKEGFLNARPTATRADWFWV